jgi:hypothetical protein
MNQQNHGDHHRGSRRARARSAAASAVAVAVLAAGLFASSPYTNEARAIDISPTITNAALVFSLTQILEGDTGLTNVKQMSLCARNLEQYPGYPALHYRRSQQRAESL